MYQYLTAEQNGIVSIHIGHIQFIEVCKPTMSIK